MATDGATHLDMRLATPADLDEVVQTLVEAFANDPVWSWGFPDAEARAAQHAVIFRMMVGHAITTDSVWVTPGFDAIITAFAPGVNELSDEEAARLPDVFHELLGDHASGIMELFDRFDEARPTETPHLYISMLGVRDRARGQGIGMALLDEVMKQADAAGIGVYLESSNHANDRRYARLGFEPHGSIPVAAGREPVTTMWRDARGGA
jgi:GNAT superfamily N-acetyltransferase